jgi:sec-independent protein translocase protein TatB
MFDIGTGELALIAVVALLVLGPERLPKAARTAGAIVRRARASWQNVRSEIERELAAEELKQSIKREADQLDPRADISAALREAVHGPPKSTAPPDPPATSDGPR